jgi:chromate reductase, NAD(P)H dehydrogenase (quinone)
VAARPYILSISGSLRHQSTNTAALRTAELWGPGELRAPLFDGMAELPAFNPDDDHDPWHPVVAHLRNEIRGARAVLFSTPEYAGALPGSFKNLLDWCVGDDQPGSMNGKPVAWLNVAARGAPNAHESLALVLDYLGAQIIESACRAIPVTSAMVGEDGVIADQEVRRQIAELLGTLATATST